MQCTEKNKVGKPCSAPAVRGTDRCVMHSGRAAELGGKGGRRRRVYNLDVLRPFDPPKNAADLRDILGQLIIELRSGKLDPKIANSINYIGMGFLQAVETADLEARVALIEALKHHEVESTSKN
jgi:hypothetical protein